MAYLSFRHVLRARPMDASATTMACRMSLLLFIATAALGVPVAAYTNHTVGGSAGWFFNATVSAPAANYSVWAASQNFSLGDYLIFNTNINQTLIQTYNLTVYRNCSIDDSSGNDTFVFSGGNSASDTQLTYAVPLIIEGANYYFSDADDGLQCQRGMAFEIKVDYGAGLPPSLNQPPPPPYTPPPSPSADDSAPGTVPQKPGNGGFRSGVEIWTTLSISLLLKFLF